MDGFICVSPNEHTKPAYSPSKVHNPTSIIPLAKSVKFEDSLRFTGGLARPFIGPRYGFHVRGPRPEGWHLGQKDMPRSCTETRSMAPPQMGKQELRVPLFITPLVPLILRGRNYLLYEQP
jgi:hypothetical protein